MPDDSSSGEGDEKDPHAVAPFPETHSTFCVKADGTNGDVSPAIFPACKPEVPGVGEIGVPVRTVVGIGAGNRCCCCCAAAAAAAAAIAAAFGGNGLTGCPRAFRSCADSGGSEVTPRKAV